jgi:hypothetical protein
MLIPKHIKTIEPDELNVYGNLLMNSITICMKAILSIVKNSEKGKQQ